MATVSYDEIRSRLLRRKGWLWRRRRDFYRFRSRTRLYYDYARHRSIPTTPLLVIGTARVGSYLLTSYLHSLPDVSMRGEVLNPAEHPAQNALGELTNDHRSAQGTDRNDYVRGRDGAQVEIVGDDANVSNRDHRSLAECHEITLLFGWLRLGTSSH